MIEIQNKSLLSIRAQITCTRGNCLTSIRDYSDFHYQGRIFAQIKFYIQDIYCINLSENGEKKLITVDVDKSEKYYIDYEDKIAIWLLIKRINSDMFLKQITFVHKKKCICNCNKIVHRKLIAKRHRHAIIGR